MKRTAEQIIAVVHRHAKTAEKGNVKLAVAAWNTFEGMIKELEEVHKAEIAEVERKLTKALAPPPPPPAPKKKVFINGKLVSQ